MGKRFHVLNDCPRPILRNDLILEFLHQNFYISTVNTGRLCENL